MMETLLWLGGYVAGGFAYAVLFAYVGTSRGLRWDVGDREVLLGCGALLWPLSVLVAAGWLLTGAAERKASRRLESRRELERRLEELERELISKEAR
jgi:hypothetical protein